MSRPFLLASLAGHGSVLHIIKHRPGIKSLEPAKAIRLSQIGQSSFPMSSSDEWMNACPHMQKRVSVISVGWTMKGNLLCIDYAETF